MDYADEDVGKKADSFRAQYVPMLTMVNVQLLLPEVLFFLVNIGKPHVVVVILMT